ncbi:L,D-transpeptidase [Primorskyibacter sedentarius]|uniref:L,D-transpeptidase-like protein n=1 Tax=Primorskyibacter sedentarius TaxID=745311 RepID=A0A4V6NYL5_9RHOB|nr:L,D-transpeptidase [Primorskyibacter sedentarius]TCS65611.1 L,D-transpeptidase-like protein [Primorskyibacter sedentarius]
MRSNRITRRALLSGAAVTLFTPAILRAQGQVVRSNVSSFMGQDWRDHFETLGVGAIVCDTGSRALHYWNADGSDYRIYPTSVPKTDELTKRGYTEIVRKKVGPSWTPTASQMERFPDWKPVPGGAPENPLGSHAMYLAWPAYLIHGTHDTRKIGRRSSDGCIGLYNSKIEELFGITPVGTQVRLI